MHAQAFCEVREVERRLARELQRIKPREAA